MAPTAINQRAQDMDRPPIAASTQNVMPASRLRAVRFAFPLFAMIVATVCHSSPGTSVSMPLTIDDGGRYTAAVKLNGQGPFQFIVDTGSQTSVLPARVASQLKLQSGPVVPMIGASGSEPSATVTVDDYRSDLFDRHDEPMVIIPNDSFSKADGVLGMNAFVSGRVEFDFVKRLLTAGPSMPAPAGFMVQRGSVRQGNFMVVDVVIDGVRASAMIDTGGKQTVCNPKLQAALGLKPGDSDLLPIDPIKGVTGQQTMAWETTLDTLLVDGVTFSEPTVAFADLPVFRVLGLDDGPAMIIGIDQLSSLQALAIDYPRAELQLR